MHPRYEGCVATLPSQVSCAQRERERERAEWLLWPNVLGVSFPHPRPSRHWKTRRFVPNSSCQPRRHWGSDVASTLCCAGSPPVSRGSPRGGLRCARACVEGRLFLSSLMAHCVEVSACSGWRPGAPNWWGGPGAPGAACASAARSSGP